MYFPIRIVCGGPIVFGRTPLPVHRRARSRIGCMNWSAAAAVSMGLAVAIGAFGAHALKEIFTADYNRRFSVQAREPQLSFKPLITGHNLKDIFCIKELRKIAPGNTFSYNELGHYVINEKQDLRYRSVVIRHFADFTTDYEVYGKKVTVTHLGKRKIKPLAA